MKGFDKLYKAPEIKEKKPRKKRERKYSAEFMNQVVDYALKVSQRQAGKKFKVDQKSAGNWIRLRAKGEL